MSVSWGVTTSTIVSALILKTKWLEMENTAVNWTILHTENSMKTLWRQQISFTVEQT